MKKHALLLLFIFIFNVSFSQIKKPNIVWITTEDMSYHIGAFGCKEVKTPNLDKLAAEGIKYTNLFSTAGVCAPSRAAIITGMYQTSIGAHNMRTTYGKDYEAIIQIPPYSVVLPENVKPYPIILKENGYYTSNNSKEDYQFETPKGMWNQSSKNAHWRNRKDKTQPFFSIFNFTVTHESQVFSRDNEPLTVKLEDVEIPAYLPDNEIMRKDFARFMTNVELMDKQVGEIIAQLKADGLYENTYIFFYPDHGDGLPFCKREVLHRGMKVPLIVKYPKNKNAGITDTQLISFVDLAPSLFSIADIKIPDFIQGRSFINSNTKNRKYVFGARDRMDTQYDRVRSVSDGRFQYLKNYNLDSPYYQDISYRKQQKGMMEILRLRDAGLLNEKQMHWFTKPKPAEELYDTETDPDQFINLIENPKYEEIAQTLRLELEKWQNETGDLGGKPEKEIIANWWDFKPQRPITAEPIISINKNIISVSCETKGALIAYKIGSSDDWLPYTQPLKVKTTKGMKIVAQRIGYDSSNVKSL